MAENDATTTLAFSTIEAQRLTGLSARRLQYWDETEFIRPSVAARNGRGSPRLYSFRDLVELRIAAQLRDRLSLQALRGLKTALDIEAPFATLRFGATVHGETVYIGPIGPESAREPMQIVMTFDLPLEEIRNDLRERIQRLRTRRGVGMIEGRRGVMGGQDRIAGTRITPGTINRLVSDGWSVERIRAEYPEIEARDIAAASRVARPTPKAS